MTIFDLINAKEIGTYYTSNASAKIPLLGATLFPAKKQLGLDLSWIKGSKGLPVALKPAAFDTKTPLRDRIGVDKLETEMPFFKEGTLVKEKDRQELNKVLMSGNQAIIDPTINKIFDDVVALVEGADVQPERMTMQLLSTGKIAISAEGVDYNYDYLLDTANQTESLVGTAKWSDTTNSNPIADIKRWQSSVNQRTGTKPSKAVCTEKTWGYLLSNSKIRLDMNPAGGQNVILTDTMLQQYLLAKLGLRVAVYDKKFKDEAGATKNYFPDEIFTLIPDGNLGNVYYGTTPEESDLMTGASDADVKIVNTGVAITTIKQADPVNVLTKVTEIVLPSFERIDEIFIATIHS
ncbi:phage capsid protein [bacterium]|nr:MAG: phage capsid protein [bacterium]